MCMHAQNLTIYRLTQGHTHQLIVVAGSRSATLVVFQLHMGLLLCKVRALDLCKATPIFLRHILVPANLLEPHTALCTTPTDSLLYVLVISSICIAMYLQYANSTSSNTHLGFSHPDHIWVWPGLLSRSPGHPDQQLWPGFNAVIAIPIKRLSFVMYEQQLFCYSVQQIDTLYCWEFCSSCILCDASQEFITLKRWKIISHNAETLRVILQNFSYKVSFGAILQIPR